MFCDKCGSIGVPIDGLVICNNCGRNLGRVNINIKKNKEDKGPNRLIPERGGSVFFKCPRCNHVKGERYEVPPQYGDEDSGFYLKCTNCGFAKKEEGSKTG